MYHINSTLYKQLVLKVAIKFKMYRKTIYRWKI